jgi:hypothetical protein
MTTRDKSSSSSCSSCVAQGDQIRELEKEQMADARFRVLSIADAKAQGLPGIAWRDTDYGCVLYDFGTQPPICVASDRMEPEDANFWRDMGWIPELLNELTSQLTAIQGERDKLAAELDFATDAVAALNNAKLEAEGERDQLKAEAALYDNAQCITCKKHLDIEAENEAEKTYTSQLLQRAEQAEGERDALRAPLMLEIAREIAKATRKFPTWPTRGTDAAAIVAEESGELQQAVLQATYEGGSADTVRKEAIQTAAMAIQFLLNLPDTRFDAGEQLPKRLLEATLHAGEGKL